MNRTHIATILLILAGMPFFLAQACGPDFGPDVFIRKLRPDQPTKFAKGQLGVLLPTYPRKDLIVAFRYLNGGTLTKDEQGAYEPTYTLSESESDAAWNAQDLARRNTSPNDPFKNWTIQRDSFAFLVPNSNTPKKHNPAEYIPYEDPYGNCLADSYRVAATTLRMRAQAWGEKSADLVDWLRGQDAVFANCNAKPHLVPPAPPANASALLRADRAYQTAAAHFYFDDLDSLDKASREFEAIGQDSTSPWHTIAPYLAARSMVRRAFHIPVSNDQSAVTSYDPAWMKKAAEMLTTQLKEHKPGSPRKAILTELNLVRLRVDAPARIHELSGALSGPKPDPGYRQHLIDLTWYLDSHLDDQPLRGDVSDFSFPVAKGQEGRPNITSAQRSEAFSATYNQSLTVRSSSTLVDWLLTFQSSAKEANAHAFAEWHKTHQPYWLLASITKASASDSVAPELIKAAAALKPDAPGWESFTYHRLRLLIAQGHADEARAELDELLPSIRTSGRDSAANAYLGLRMYAAADLNDLLTYAPHKVLLRNSEEAGSVRECLEVMKDPKRKYGCKDDTDAAQFSEDATSFFNAQAPLATLVDAAQSNTLPGRLRQAVAIMAWVRSVLLKDDAAAAKLFPLLPAKLQQQAGAGTGFLPLVTIVRNPGLRPYLDAGIQRAYSYDFVESYRDNWWCGDWGVTYFSREPVLQSHEPAAFLTPQQRGQAAQELRMLLQHKSAKLYLGEQVLAYAQDHGNDPDVPESLYLVLRMIRWGCDTYVYPETPEEKAHEKSIATLRSDAARLLRQRYTNSPWTKKAGPIAGPTM
jgi:hypothetical protein